MTDKEYIDKLEKFIGGCFHRFSKCKAIQFDYVLASEKVKFGDLYNLYRDEEVQ